MITKTQYQKALQIIEDYNEQIFTQEGPVYDALKFACNKLGTSIAEVHSKGRQRNLVYNRCLIANYLYGQNLDLTLQKIGRLLNRDHASVIHYLKSHENLLYYTDYKSKNDSLYGND